MAADDYTSPEQLAQQRRMAQMLAQQATSADPVGHWTQALARTLQGASSSMWGNQAAEAEGRNRDLTMGALNQSPEFSKLSDAERGMFANNPGLMNQVAGQVYGNKFDPLAGLKQQQIKEGILTAQQQRAQSGAMHPEELRQVQLRNQTSQRELDTPQQKINIIPAGGKAIITDPRSTEHKVIDNNDPKLSVEEQKLVAEGDKSLLSTHNGIATVRQLKELNKTAYQGPLAGFRGYTGSLANSKAAQDTQLMQTLLVQEALDTLRATFGGNPTEGERKILIEVQGSINQAAPVRERIFDRADKYLQMKLAQQKQQVEQIRAGTYFKPGAGSAAQPPAAVPAPTTLPASGGPPQRLRYNPATGALE